MANLSNINGKFVVDTAGNIGVGTLIPRSDANTTNISIQSSGTARLFVNNTGASGKEYAIYSSANGDFGIFDYGAVSARLVINSAGNSTFAGNVMLDVNNWLQGHVTVGGGTQSLIRSRAMGYPGYYGCQVGEENNHIALFIDPLSVAGGSFSGNVNELMLPNKVIFQQANAVSNPTNWLNGQSITLDNGKVGIGTISPGAKLEVAGGSGAIAGTGLAYFNNSDDAFSLVINNVGTSSQNDRGVFDARVGGSSVFRINNSGNVGIGTTSPSARLEVYGTDGSRTHFNEGLRVTRETVPAQFGMVNFNGGALNMIAVNTAGTGSVTKFMRSGNGTSLDTSMIIDNDGNVGIGTNSPTEALQIAQGEAIKLGDYFFLGSGDSNYMGSIGFNRDTSNGNIFNSSYGAYQIHNYQGALKLQVYSSAGGTIGEHKFYNDGTISFFNNVGIGTTSPAAALDIKHASVPLITRSTNNNAIAMFNEISGGYSHLYLYQINAGARVAISTNGNSYFNGGSVGIGTTPETGTLLHLEKNSAANTVTELLRLDCGENSHAAGKGGKIVFRDINVYNDTATIEAVRLSASSGSTLNFRLRNSANGPILALRSDHIAQFQGTSTSDIIKINSGTGLNANVGMIIFQDNSNNYLGQITANSATTTTSYLSASDYRLKEDLKDFNGLDLVSNIKVYDFKWKAADERTYGVIAHELNEVIPQAVDGEKDAERMQSADYSKIVPVLVKAIQELKADNDSLKARIETLENN